MCFRVTLLLDGRDHAGGIRLHVYWLLHRLEFVAGFSNYSSMNIRNSRSCKDTGHARRNFSCFSKRHFFAL
jgi:hypothetical protein